MLTTRNFETTHYPRLLYLSCPKRNFIFSCELRSVGRALPLNTRGRLTHSTVCTYLHRVKRMNESSIPIVPVICTAGTRTLQSPHIIMSEHEYVRSKESSDCIFPYRLSIHSFQTTSEWNSLFNQSVIFVQSKQHVEILIICPLCSCSKSFFCGGILCD